MCSLTEKDCLDLLMTTCKNFGEVSPRVITHSRSQNKNSITRKVRFALVVTANNVELLDALILACLERTDDLYFVGSEMNLQGDLNIDYLYFEADIFANKQQ